MTTIPLTILDNFLDNPDAIRDFALSLELTPHPEGKWPGKRSKNISEIHPLFYNYINKKILNLFFEDSIEFKCDLSFQLLEDYQGEGWIHQDPSIFTFIIYLSKEDEVNCGTSLYNLKLDKFHPINSSKDHDFQTSRIDHHKTKFLPIDIQSQKSKYRESHFIKSIDIKDKYNRLLCFSSELFHSANTFSNTKNSRLTLIGFVNYISSCNLPIIRSKQTPM